MGNWERATIEFEKAHKSDPGSMRNIQDLALTYYLTGKYEDAMKLLNGELIRNPDLPGLYIQKIVCSLMRDGNTKQARKVLQDAAKQNISEISLMTLPFCFTQFIDIYEGNYQDALDLIVSEHWEGYNSLNWYYPKSIFQAMIYDLMDFPEQAYAYYDSARIILENKLQEFPEDPRILSSLGIAYASLGQKEKAMSYGREAVKKCTLEMDALRGTFRIHDLAWMYVQMEDYDPPGLVYIRCEPIGNSFI